MTGHVGADEFVRTARQDHGWRRIPGGSPGIEGREAEVLREFGSQFVIAHQLLASLRRKFFGLDPGAGFLNPENHRETDSGAQAHEWSFLQSPAAVWFRNLHLAQIEIRRRRLFCTDMPLLLRRLPAANTFSDSGV